ncbi:hypothetical protein FRC12_017266 [Ceratobasidium sp. 428]|nr:hypothetical protein FRC12_017266 [Ceratobasidium sp. 428]
MGHLDSPTCGEREKDYGEGDPDPCTHWRTGNTLRITKHSGGSYEWNGQIYVGSGGAAIFIPAFERRRPLSRFGSLLPGPQLRTTLSLISRIFSPALAPPPPPPFFHESSLFPRQGCQIRGWEDATAGCILFYEKVIELL